MTIDLRNKRGDSIAQVEVLQEVSLGGVPGFAIHRSLDRNGKPCNLPLYTLTHIASGSAMARNQPSAQAAIVKSWSLVKAKAQEKGVSARELLQRSIDALTQ